MRPEFVLDSRSGGGSRQLRGGEVGDDNRFQTWPQVSGGILKEDWGIIPEEVDAPSLGGLAFTTSPKRRTTVLLVQRSQKYFRKLIL